MNTEATQAILAAIKDVRDELTQDLREVKGDLKEVAVEVKKTNGRVTALETQRTVDVALAKRRREVLAEAKEDEDEEREKSHLNKTLIVSVVSSLLSGGVVGVLAILLQSGG